MTIAIVRIYIMWVSSVGYCPYVPDSALNIYRSSLLGKGDICLNFTFPM